MDRTEKAIILLTILGLCLILWLSLLTTGCQTPYADYGFGVDELDNIVGANECVTDGFDWVCRGPTQYITVEKVHVETSDPVEIVIREIYLVEIAPKSVIETPVRTIETDADGDVVTPPDDVTIVVLDPMPDAEEEEDDVIVVEQNPILPPIQNDPPAQKRYTELAYLHQTAQGFWQVGFIYLDYVLLVEDQLTFLGADKKRDVGDRTITVRDYRFLSGDYDPHVVAETLFGKVL